MFAEALKGCLESFIVFGSRFTKDDDVVTDVQNSIDPFEGCLNSVLEYFSSRGSTELI